MNHKLPIFLIILAGCSLSAYALATSTFISDAGIITPALTVGDVTITGTCTGCGGGDGNFTSYSNVYDGTIAGSDGSQGQAVRVSNDGTVMAFDSHPSVIIVKVDGTLVLRNNLPLYNFENRIAQSDSGRYQMFLNSGFTGVQLFKDTVLLQTFGFGGSFSTSVFDNMQFNISTDGKFIGIYGKDIGGSSMRLQIWEGS